MLGLYLIFLSAFIFSGVFSQMNEDMGVPTRTQPPIITSVTPNFGGTEGGTLVIVNGANFASQGLFTQRAIFIGSRVCKEIPYYTKDNTLRCIAPACNHPFCLSDPTWGWQGKIKMSLSIYVNTVEGIFGDHATFTYDGQYTPFIQYLSRYQRGNALSSLVGFFATNSVTDLTVKIANNTADVGDPDEYNPANFNLWSTTNTLFFLPPPDMEAGFYNLTLESQDDQSNGVIGTGFARTYPKQKPDSYMNYPYRYNYDASLSGTVYSVCLQPVISSVEPSSGSIAGGTVVKVKGTGFSKDMTRLTVMVGGNVCDVQSSDYEELTCITRATNFPNLQSYLQMDSNAHRLAFRRNVSANSTRNYGSPGWWVKVWNWNDYSTNQMTESRVRFSFGWHSDMDFGLYYHVGSTWPNYFSYSSGAFDWLVYAAQFNSYFIAPLSGTYEFLMESDDNAWLYGKHRGSKQGEKLLLQTWYTGIGTTYRSLNQRMSKAVYLQRGERYRLRALLSNGGGGPDRLQIGVRIKPNSTVSEELPPSAFAPDATTHLYNLTDRTRDKHKFLYHHSLKSIQLISLTVGYQQEIQTLIITGIEGGTFNLIVQDLIPTSDLQLTSTSNEISNALYYAAAQISYNIRECLYFSVTKSLSNGGKDIQIKVQFQTDNSMPLKFLSVFLGNTLGSNLTTNTIRNQLHSPIPSGMFALTYFEPGDLLTNYTIQVPYNVNANRLRTLLQGISSDIIVDVSGSGSISGGSWLVTFTTPIGNVPTMSINASTVSGSIPSGYVQRIQNGSADSYYFQTIPSWMTEVPLDWATKQSVRSNVEVYVSTQTGEHLKAVCDGASTTNNPTSNLKGDEHACEYNYASQKTPLLEAYSLYTVDADTTGIEIKGNYLARVLANNVPSAVTVAIAEYPCNITFKNATYIHCLVDSVPWGSYVPVVNIEGFGNAILATNQMLRFKQSIYSMEPKEGSLAGGQILTITGRGFRSNALITLEDNSVPCKLISYKSTEIKCITPPAPSFTSKSPTFAPTAIPTIVPTFNPSTVPTFVPTNLPTLIPSTYPSSYPTAVPTVHPTAKPTTASPTTSVPSTDPTFTPSSEPTDAPSYNPTEEPTTLSPTQSPTLSPTALPTTAVPSEIPTSFPSSLPSSIPTSIPTAFPTILPTAIPTSFPTPFPTAMKRANHSRKLELVEETVILSDRRNLLSNPFENQYHVLVDGQNATNFDETLYTYSYALTPVVHQLTPDKLSSAITYNITFIGERFLSNPVIQVGEQPCLHVRMDGSFTIGCVLNRDANFGRAREVEVKIYFDNIGYAASPEDITAVPVVKRGFALSEVRPLNGSVMGGNQMRLEGFGFLDNAPGRHTVKFTQIGLEGYTTYDDLLLSLGFPSYTNYTEENIFYCNVTQASFYYLDCDIRGHDLLPFNESQYNISISLNNIGTVCSSDDGTNCTYSQVWSRTPTINSSFELLDISSLGQYTATIYGDLLNAGELEVFADNIPCNIVMQDETAVTIFTAPLTYGSRMITAHVVGYGNAYSTAYFDAGATIYNVTFDTAEGSLLGGTKVEMQGYGFSRNCKENVVLFNVEGAVSTTLVVDEYIRCTPTLLVFRTPSMEQYLPQPLLSSSEFGSVVMSIDFTVDTMNAIGASISLNGSSASAIFQYSLAFTPQVTLSQSHGFANDALNITAYSLSPEINEVEVRIGEEMCYEVNSHVNARASPNRVNYYTGVVTCFVPPLPASTIPYRVYARVDPVGYAMSNATKQFAYPSLISKFHAKVLSAQAIPSGIRGGTNITVNGAGFGEDTYVTICDRKCVVNSTTTYSSLSCSLPARWSTEAIKDIQAKKVKIDLIKPLNGSTFSSLNIPTSKYLLAAFDANYSSYFKGGWNKNCFIGIRLPPGYQAQPYRMLFYPRIQYSTYIKRFAFEGLLPYSTNYVTIATTTGAHEGWNFVEAQNYTNQWFVAFRYRALDTTSYSQCYLAEVGFSGILGATNGTCDIQVHSPASNTVTKIGKVHYDYNTLTPTISSIAPNNGSALGGETITIYGTGFHPTTHYHDLSVTLSGVDCRIVSSADSSITCITGSRSPDKVERSEIKVNIGGKGLAVVSDDVEYLYIDRWSALTSWRYQEPPVDGDVVWIPDGQVILLDQCTPRLTFLLIEGDLYFDRNTPLITLDSYYIFILGGYMEVGTEEHPYESTAIITLHGDRYKTIEIPVIGNKMIAVAHRGLPYMEHSPGNHIPARNQGQLEIHGKKRLRTWTKVNTTAYAGDYFLITSEPVDFQPGEKIVLTGSEIPSGDYQVEELIVASNVDNHNITFTTALKHTHRSEIHFIEGKKVDLRIEVGLLSRNIVVQGDNETSSGQLYGVHTVAMMSGIFRIENAEYRRCGQAFNFGRYCTHSHMGGNMQGSYVKANSIHHSFQRCVTTHDTNDWEVRDNVAFDIGGHCFFVEDGTEMRNYFTGNLGIRIRKSSALLESDTKPAVFWTKTPFNYWRDNVGVHSANNGFWFEPGGSDDGLCPVHMPIGEFYNNTMHSNSVMGLRIYPQYTPLADPCGSLDGKSAPQYLYHLLAFRNGNHGLFGKKNGDLHHISPILVENAHDDINIIKYELVQYTDDPNIVDALIVGILPESYSPGMDLGKFGLHHPQGEFFYVKGATFVNYGSSGAIAGCNGCLSGNLMAQGAFTTRFEGLKFVNTEKRVVWVETEKEILWDLDGTLAGVPDSMVTKYHPYLNFQEVCTVLQPQSVFPNAIRCGGNGSTARIRRLQVESVTPSQLPFTDVLAKSIHGDGEFFFLPLDTYGWVFPVVTGANRSYTMEFADSGISAYTFSLTLGRPEYLLETLGNPSYDENTVFAYRPQIWDYDPYSFAVTYNSKTKYASRNTTAPLKRMADSFYKNNTFQTLLTNKGAALSAYNKFGVYAAARLCPPAGCPIPPPPSLSNPMPWSRKSSWPSKRIPVAGQTVVIPSDYWIVLDVSPPKLACVIVYGKLTFKNNVTDEHITLTTTCIQVYGTFQIMSRDNSSYDGQATVVLYGTKQQVLPVTMTEGVFLGSKVIGVVGEMTVIGQPKVHTWVKLNATAHAGSNTLMLSQAANWTVGDEIAIAPTGYFTDEGYPWFMSSRNSRGSSDEIRTIKSVKIVTDAGSSRSYTLITINGTLGYTHLCTQKEGKEFCGAVGVLTRNVRFISQDSEDPKSKSYGFGGNIHVFDIPFASPPRYGRLNMVNVEMKYFGKVNSDHYAITMAYRDYNHPPSIIKNCSFNAGYNTVFRVSNTYNLTFANNVAIRTTAGGVYVESNNRAFNILNNLIIGTRQLPAVILSMYPWVRPIASYMILSPNGVVRNNIAAGSEDQGFSVAMATFHVPSQYRSACTTTTTLPYSYSVLDNWPGNAIFANNEAVACKGGLTMVGMSPSESRVRDCAVVSEIFVWRCGHTGINAVDVIPNVLIHKATLAENYIGVNIEYFRSANYHFTGLVASTIISSLGNNDFCGDLPDSTYRNGKQCHAFGSFDTLAQQYTCSSILNNIYRRVGFLVPQWTNAPRTCAFAQRFDECDPPHTPDRLCEMPWEKRYGLPTDLLYAENHIHDTKFIGFHSRTFNSTNGLEGQCIPQTFADRSVAIATNPSQLDSQPVTITSGLEWVDTDSSAKIGFDLGSFAGAGEGSNPAQGQMMKAIYDLDGSFGNKTASGQYFFNNPEYIREDCYEMAEVALGLFFCQNTGKSEDFRQYRALWRDWGPQVIQPITVRRVFDDANRTYASYGPIKDLCPMRFYFSQFNLFFSTNTVHYVMSTGTIPGEWLIRWDAPTEDEVAILDFFIQKSVTINVYVSDSPDANFVHVPKIYRYPLFNETAGTNFRDPQKRSLAVVVRGGAKRFYKFQLMPVASVTIRMDMTFEQFFADTFIANMALLLNISPKRIKVASVRAGSVIADFSVAPSITTANSSAALVSQIEDLHAVTANLTVAIQTGSIQTALNVTVLQVFAVPPVVPVVLDPTFTPPVNSTYNDTAVRLALIQANQPPTLVLFDYPTSLPTSQPSNQPSSQPSMQPTGNPTGQPSSAPTSLPTSQPSVRPTSQPSSVPSALPTTQPSCQPTSNPTQPSSQPTSQPTSFPSALPTSQPSTHPTSQPTSQPTIQPSGQPTGQPISRPTSQPTRQPSGQPTAQPVSFPTSQPTRQPTSQPTGQPSRQPTSQPTRQPTRQPTGQPTAQPIGRPTSKPTGQPSGQPTAQPISHPTSRPTGQPSSRPTSRPSAQPSGQPSAQPVAHPTSRPTVQPSGQPTAQPVCHPTSYPTSQPSSSPSGQPSAQPSGKPSAVPTVHPTHHPTKAPTFAPTALPTFAPSAVPTKSPTFAPSATPTFSPTATPTMLPTFAPSAVPTNSPTFAPSATPTFAPSAVPTNSPTFRPSAAPTFAPSAVPTNSPTFSPSATPTFSPTATPTVIPTFAPSAAPTNSPSFCPSVDPTFAPSAVPTNSPSFAPSETPTFSPTASPTDIPTCEPSAEPTFEPSSIPTLTPSAAPSDSPTFIPTLIPTAAPSETPSDSPSYTPSASPSYAPSAVPSADPTASPTELPSYTPSATPTAGPSFVPTFAPSFTPSVTPTELPSYTPSANPTAVPTFDPTFAPSYAPSTVPSVSPSHTPSFAPSSAPSTVPTELPTFVPSTIAPSQLPTEVPSIVPSAEPSVIPTVQPTINPTTESPSFAPTYLPSYSPTTSPSFGPTKTPSASPSASPSATPTATPSVAPTYSPSQTPTETPSVIPSQAPTAEMTRTPTYRPSTLTPTISPTTRAPTTATQTEVSFSCAQTFQGCTVEDYTNNPSARDALETSIADTVRTDEIDPVITITNVVDAATTRRLLAVVTTLVAANGGIQVSYDVTMYLSATSSIDPTTAYATFVSTLNASIHSGALATALQSSGVSIFANVTTSRAFTVTDMTTKFIDRTTSVSKEQSITSRADFIAGITIGIFIMLFAIGFWLISSRKSYARRSSKEIKVVPINAEQFSDLEDLVRLQSKVHDSGGASPNRVVLPRNARHATTSFGGAEEGQQIFDAKQQSNAVNL